MNIETRMSDNYAPLRCGYHASFVGAHPHVVTEFVRDRAVICYRSVVVAAMNVNDLTLA